MKFIFLFFVCLAFAPAVFAQQPAANVRKIYQNIKVEKFTIKEGVKFEADNIDPMAMRIGRSFEKSKRFEKVEVIGVTPKTETAKTIENKAGTATKPEIAAKSETATKPEAVGIQTEVKTEVGAKPAVETEVKTEVNPAPPVAASETASDVPTLRVTGEVIKFKKGSQVGRYMLGVLGGKLAATVVTAYVKFIDDKTGEVVWEQEVDGEVSWGLFGGDSDDAKGGVADEIVRVAKKNFGAEKKKKS